MSRWLKSLTVVSLALSAHALVAQDATERVLVRAAKPYAAAIAAVTGLGGSVRHQFKYVDAIAAEVPRSAVPALKAMLGPGAVSKDEVISAPRPIDVPTAKGGPPIVETASDRIAEGSSGLDQAALVQFAETHPAAYLINNGIANVSGQHAAGYTGQGVIVAVIDSGIRPGHPHLTLDGSVVGCEDFVLDALGCSNANNDGHGTFVAGMISANVVFTFSPLTAFRNAVLAECPGCFLNPPTNTQIPMIGTAPLSSIYALRVFGPTGGAPTSRVMAAMERAIELRELHDAGNPAGRDIRVCNMSLGGPTLAAGRDLFDQAADALLDHGIVPVIAAANAGPASLTIASPGSAANALTVGAASLPHNERILRRLQFGPALGSLYRPFLGVQMSFFSSRGPNADGRLDPDVVSNGFANFGQGFSGPTIVNIGSGTSYATPSVSGVSAVLVDRFPTASARLIRNAIIVSANPGILSDDSTELDQGNGYVNAGAAAAMLAAGTVPANLPGLGPYDPSVAVNVETNTDLEVRDGNVSESVTGLKPGERFDVLYRVRPNTGQVVIVLNGVTPVLPPEEQNQLFGDDILFTVHSAKTSAIGEGDYQVLTFSTGGTFVINNPEDGIMRITVNGDWTNAGEIGASVHIFSVTAPAPGLTAQGKIETGQTVVIPLTIPAGTATADFRLSWHETWGRYPTNDIDLYLVRPNSTVDVSGATLDSPERVQLVNPPAGNWLMVVNGFDVFRRPDRYELRVTLDGKVVK